MLLAKTGIPCIIESPSDLSWIEEQKSSDSRMIFWGSIMLSLPILDEAILIILLWLLLFFSLVSTGVKNCSCGPLTFIVKLLNFLRQDLSFLLISSFSLSL